MLFGKRETSNLHCDEQEAVCNKWLDVTCVSVATFTVQYNMILHTLLSWLGQNINQSLNIQKTSHSSLVRARFGMSFAMNVEKIDHAKPASHYTSLHWHMMKPCLWSYYPDECHFNRQPPRVVELYRYHLIYWWKIELYLMQKCPLFFQRVYPCDYVVYGIVSVWFFTVLLRNLHVHVDGLVQPCA